MCGGKGRYGTKSSGQKGKKIKKRKKKGKEKKKPQTKHLIGLAVPVHEEESFG